MNRTMKRLKRLERLGRSGSNENQVSDGRGSVIVKILQKEGVGPELGVCTYPWTGLVMGVRCIRCTRCTRCIRWSRNKKEDHRSKEYRTNQKEGALDQGQW
jgi:hypothetical protein